MLVNCFPIKWKSGVVKHLSRFLPLKSVKIGQSKNGIPMRFLRALTSYGTAILIIVLIAVWFSTGIFVQGGNGPTGGEQTVVSMVEPDGGPISDAVEGSGYALEVHHDEGVDDPAISIAERNALAAQIEGELRIVRIERFNIQPMKLEVTLRGHTEASSSLNVVAQTTDIVETVAVTEGQMVEAGDLICTLHAGTRRGGVEQAKAAVAQAQAGFTNAMQDYEVNVSLVERGVTPENTTEAFAANLRAAEAGLATAQVSLQMSEDALEKITITAGLSGVVQGPIAEVGALMNFGSSCASIIQLDTMVFVGAVPQARISLAKLGMPAVITTINGETATGEVTFIAVSSDPATRTFKVEIEFENSDRAILDGLTAEALVDMGSIPAHLLPQSALTLDSTGVLGVQAVKDGAVVFYPVQILGDARTGIWVSGLPIAADVIILGQEYVTEGQNVDARYAE